MTRASVMTKSRTRHAPLAMDRATFRALGHALVDDVAEMLEGVPDGPVTRDGSPTAIREALGLNGPLAEAGTDAAALLRDTARGYSTIRSSMRIRVFSGTSRRRRRRSAFWVISSRRR